MERVNSLPHYLEYAQECINKKIDSIDQPRTLGSYKNADREKLIKKYKKKELERNGNKKLIKELVSDFFVGIPLWSSPKLVHNVGSPTNLMSNVIYSLALEQNIYNINEMLSGNALVAEQIVINIMSKLAGINQQTAGFFTFGGTGTNLYATRMGIKKSEPNSAIKGVRRIHKMIVTEDSHFSHTTCADWLGVGRENVVKIKANEDRRSNLVDAEAKMRKILDSGFLLSSIIINGGTTYDHTIDEIYSFSLLRDKMVKEYSLEYKPHLHVDSVIGWQWLFFSGYNWKKNPLKIGNETIKIVKEQYERIAKVKYCDSWSIDFHKGIGGCPIPSSVVIFNSINDINLLSKKNGSSVRMAEINEDFSLSAPAEFTLETSRPGGSSLAALASIYSMGKDGFQKRLTNLLEQTITIRKELRKQSDIFVCNSHSLGYATMVRLYPPELCGKEFQPAEQFMKEKKDYSIANYSNNYLKKFFEWEFEKRISKTIGFEYSYSGAYLKSGEIELSALKIYPVSPHFSKSSAMNLCLDLKNKKEEFDSEVWKNDQS